MPGKEPGKTMLDETLICVIHEFGRNPEMNSNGGRDHWGACFTNMFIGGGVKPGRVVGKTDGYKTLDNGWAHKEQPMMDHVVSTSIPLWIDWSRRSWIHRRDERTNTGSPLGTAFIPQTPIEGCLPKGREQR
jgi:hypothetical protein